MIESQLDCLTIFSRRRDDVNQVDDEVLGLRVDVDFDALGRKDLHRRFDLAVLVRLEVLDDEVLAPLFAPHNGGDESATL